MDVITAIYAEDSDLTDEIIVGTNEVDISTPDDFAVIYEVTGLFICNERYVSEKTCAF